MSSPSTSHPKNHSLLSIPAAYALAYPPYMYQFYRGMSASNYTATNIAPRTNLEILRGKIPTSTYNSLVRARGAHLNALEGFPLFAAAMVGTILSSPPVYSFGFVGSNDGRSTNNRFVYSSPETK